MSTADRYEYDRAVNEALVQRQRDMADARLVARFPTTPRPPQRVGSATTAQLHRCPWPSAVCTCAEYHAAEALRQAHAASPSPAAAVPYASWIA